MKHTRAIALSTCIFLLTACQTWNGVVEDISSLDIPIISPDPAVDTQSEQFLANANCPTVKIVDELSMLNEYMDISDPQNYNLISGVNLSQVESSCTYSGKNATVDLKLAFDGRLGPRARIKTNDQPFFSYPFFIAVTAPNGTILAKEVFSASIAYDTGKNEQTYYESMRQIIPISNPARGNRYKVLVGFQLSQEQLNRNRLALQTPHDKIMLAPGGDIANQPNALTPAAGQEAPMNITPQTEE